MTPETSHVDQFDVCRYVRLVLKRGNVLRKLPNCFVLQIQFELVGTESERNAVGARIKVTTDSREFTTWVTSGGGYLASDERVMDVSIGAIPKIDKVEITWPSGKSQQLDTPEINRRYLVIEGLDNGITWKRSLF